MYQPKDLHSLALFWWLILSADTYVLSIIWVVQTLGCAAKGGYNLDLESTLFYTNGSFLQPKMNILICDCEWVCLQKRSRKIVKPKVLVCWNWRNGAHHFRNAPLWWIRDSVMSPAFWLFVLNLIKALLPLWRLELIHMVYICAFWHIFCSVSTLLTILNEIQL